jgi:hypothetical protein
MNGINRCNYDEIVSQEHGVDERKPFSLADICLPGGEFHYRLRSVRAARPYFQAYPFLREITSIQGYPKIGILDIRHPAKRID